jgi:hypothetical protein
MKSKERRAREKRLSELRAKGQRLGDEIRRLDNANTAEDAAPFIGACFKYLNRDHTGDAWWIFFRVVSLDGSAFRTLQCQSQSGGWHIVTTKDHTYLLPDPKARGFTRITRREFDAAWRRHVARIAALNS